MARLLLRLRGVPEDEQAELRAMLDEHAIDWYETEEGRWGISMPGLWLKDDEQLEQAQALLEEYAQQRSEQVRRSYQEALARGEADTLWRRIARQPVQALIYLLAILFVLFLAMVPFLILGN